MIKDMFGSKFFPYREDPFAEGAINYCDIVASPASVLFSILFWCKQGIQQQQNNNYVKS